MTLTAQLLANGSSELPPAFSETGSKPPPIPALEQNSEIGPNCRSLSSITCRMSFSCPTSHLNATPPTEAATASAPARSRSATITFDAPARLKASHRARPMPLAPPVTTTILPATCITPSTFWIFSGQNEIEHGRIMAGRPQQHEAVPDRILEAQPLPSVKDDSETIKQPASGDEPYRQARQRGYSGVVHHEAAPAHRKIENDRQAIETPGEQQFDHNPTAARNHIPIRSPMAKMLSFIWAMK